jgi:galactonate dehydratase
LGRELFVEPWQVVNGHIELPTQPGLGFEMNEDALKETATYREELGGEHFYEIDGSVADW